MRRLTNPLTRQLIDKIEIRHGGPEYDSKYPDGIPTSLEIDHAELGTISSGLVMYPLGHARNKSPDLDDVLAHKFRALAQMAVEDPDALRRRFSDLRQKSADDIARLVRFSHPRHLRRIA